MREKSSVYAKDGLFTILHGLPGAAVLGLQLLSVPDFFRMCGTCCKRTACLADKVPHLRRTGAQTDL